MRELLPAHTAERQMECECSSVHATRAARKKICSRAAPATFIVTQAEQRRGARAAQWQFHVAKCLRTAACCTGWIVAGITGINGCGTVFAGC